MRYDEYPLDTDAALLPLQSTRGAVGSPQNRAVAIAPLNQTIAGPTIAEVQAISDKIDELIAVLQATG